MKVVNDKRNISIIVVGTPIRLYNDNEYTKSLPVMLKMHQRGDFGRFNVDKLVEELKTQLCII